MARFVNMLISINKPAGSVLPIVLFFSVISMISVAAFVSGQYLIARPFLSKPVEFQALLNARSGIWKGIEMLSQPKRIDTLKTINTLDSLFGKDLFGKMTEAIPASGEQLTADSMPVAVQPFSSDSFGASEVSVSFSGWFELLHSRGLFKNREKNAHIKLGGSLSIHSDTVLYLEKNPPLQSPVRGKIHYGPFGAADSIRLKELNGFISYYAGKLSDSVDTMMPAIPLLIQHNDEFGKIPDIVKGPLFIDGSHFDLAWKLNKQLIVLGDLQMTGKALLEGITFIVNGEIKILDDSRVRGVTLFAAKTIFLGDRASFSGTVVSLSNIIVSGRATIENRSMILVVPKALRVMAKGKQKKSVFSATFTETSTTDASVITISDSLGIKIDKNATVKGILWTRGALCLDGKVYGIVHASKLVDGGGALSGKSSKAITVIHGSLLPFDDGSGYSVPFFMGKLSILSWQED